MKNNYIQLKLFGGCAKLLYDLGSWLSESQGSASGQERVHQDSLGAT